MIVIVFLMGLADLATKCRKGMGGGAYLGSNLGILIGVGCCSFLGYKSIDLLVDYLNLNDSFLELPLEGVGGFGGLWVGVKMWPVTSSIGSLVGYGLEKIVSLFYR